MVDGIYNGDMKLKLAVPDNNHAKISTLAAETGILSIVGAATRTPYWKKMYQCIDIDVFVASGRFQELNLDESLNWLSELREINWQ